MGQTFSIHTNRRLTKVKTMITYSIWCFCSFFHFLHSNIPGIKWHQQKWCVLFFTRIRLVVHVLACVHAITHGYVYCSEKLFWNISQNFQESSLDSHVYHYLPRSLLKVLFFSCFSETLPNFRKKPGVDLELIWGRYTDFWDT